MSALVLYDADCPLCRNLAGFAARRAGGELAFASWQGFRTTERARRVLPAEVLAQPADSLRVLVGEELRVGAEAWGLLLEAHPTLQALGWLASQLGLEEQVAASLDAGGHALRRRCRPCRRRRWA